MTRWTFPALLTTLACVLGCGGQPEPDATIEPATTTSSDTTGTTKTGTETPMTEPGGSTASNTTTRPTPPPPEPTPVPDPVAKGRPTPPAVAASGEGKAKARPGVLLRILGQPVKDAVGSTIDQASEAGLPGAGGPLPPPGARPGDGPKLRP